MVVKEAVIHVYNLFLAVIIKALLATWFYSLLLLLSGNVELNPGPERNYSNAFFYLSLESKLFIGSQLC